MNIVLHVWFSEIGSKCPFLIPKQNAVSHFVLKLSTDFAEMQYQTFLDLMLNHIKRRSKSEQYWRCESAGTDFVQNGQHDVINSNVQKMRKTAQGDILESIYVNFHQNRTSRLGCRADTHTYKHTQTHTHTDILGSILTYSVRIKNEANLWPWQCYDFSIEWPSLRHYESK